MRKCIPLFLATFSLLSLSLACGQIITLPTPTPTRAPTSDFTPSPSFAFTPSPFTPPPTFTPTFTPTPIIYVVQPGDTLSGIAAKFGVSIRIIQEANAITDPKALQAGQTLIIPQGEEALPGTPTPTPTPIPLKITGINFYREPGGNLWCFGEVLNPGEVTVESVAVRVRLYGPDSSLLAESQTFVARDLIHPGEKGPFAVVFTQPPETFSHYDVTVMSAYPAHHPSALVHSLVLKEHSWEKGPGNFFSVRGVIFNAGEKTVKDINVIIVAYDISERVVALNKIVPEKEILQPGEETTFYFTFFPASNLPVTYTLYVQGLTP
ncbi:MAG: LysM peptidoglycan-binding domain-containing protein [Anaerolineae bacterium]|nr:LysM peptidoglycan-binding domain-containing protein [Anaerolineae bacterium]